MSNTVLSFFTFILLHKWIVKRSNIKLTEINLLSMLTTSIFVNLAGQTLPVLYPEVSYFRSRQFSNDMFAVGMIAKHHKMRTDLLTYHLALRCLCNFKHLLHDDIIIIACHQEKCPVTQCQRILINNDMAKPNKKANNTKDNNNNNKITTTVI